MATTAPPVNSSPDLDTVKQFLDAHINEFPNGIAAADALVREVELNQKLSVGDYVRLQVRTCAEYNERRHPRSVQ
jgi:hypothetical protein